MREVLRSVPDEHHPVPWRIAEAKGEGFVVVCADGCYVCESSSLVTAEIIVAAVNAWAVLES